MEKGRGRFVSSLDLCGGEGERDRVGSLLDGDAERDLLDKGEGGQSEGPGGSHTRRDLCLD
jgi:hypothetical protein